MKAVAGPLIITDMAWHDLFSRALRKIDNGFGNGRSERAEER
jgi:hypothetical protein